MLTTNDMRLYEINYKCTFYEVDDDYNEEVKAIEDKVFIDTECPFEAMEMFLTMLTSILKPYCSNDDLPFYIIKNLTMDSPKRITRTIIKDVETENAKEDI